MWIIFNDIDTLDLTSRDSQLSPMTRPHTQSLPHTKHADRNQHRLSQVRRGPDGRCSDGPHSWENVNLPGFFLNWVVCQSNVKQAGMHKSANCWCATTSRHQRCQAPAGKWPVVQSGSQNTPSQRDLLLTVLWGYGCTLLASQNDIQTPAGQDRQALNPQWPQDSVTGVICSFGAVTNRI